MVNETSLEPDEMLNSTLYKAPVDPANWFGVRKDATILGYTKVRFCFTFHTNKSENTYSIWPGNISTYGVFFVFFCGFL